MTVDVNIRCADNGRMLFKTFRVEAWASFVRAPP